MRMVAYKTLSWFSILVVGALINVEDSCFWRGEIFPCKSFLPVVDALNSDEIQVVHDHGVNLEEKIIESEVDVVVNTKSENIGQQQKLDSLATLATTTTTKSIAFGASQKDTSVNALLVSDLSKQVDKDKSLKYEEFGNDNDWTEIPSSLNHKTDKSYDDQGNDDVEGIRKNSGIHNKRVWGGTSDTESTERPIEVASSKPVSPVNDVIIEDISTEIDNTRIYNRDQTTIINEKNTMSEEARLDLFDNVDDDPDPKVSSNDMIQMKRKVSTLLKSPSVHEVEVGGTLPEPFGMAKDDNGKRIWGSASGADTNQHETHHYGIPKKNEVVGDVPDVEMEVVLNATDNIHSVIQDATHASFVAVPKSHGNVQHHHHHHQSHPHHQIDGFTITARVYVDPTDAKAHFDYSDETKRTMKELTLPFWDCGALGSTTSPVHLKDAYFRTAIGAKSTSWITADEYILGRHHPVLVVALSPCLLELNSGQSLDVMSGDVLLLEDCILPGHSFRPPTMTSTTTNGIASDIKLLFLTLPQQHYRLGKENLSLQASVSMMSIDPCPDPKFNSRSEDEIIPKTNESEISNSFSSKTMLHRERRRKIGHRIDRITKPYYWYSRRLRLFVLSTLGISISTLAADFIGKTAPLWLAVGIGGTFFVGFGTYGFTVAMDRFLSWVELCHERRRLSLVTST